MSETVTPPNNCVASPKHHKHKHNKLRFFFQKFKFISRFTYFIYNTSVIILSAHLAIAGLLHRICCLPRIVKKKVHSIIIIISKSLPSFLLLPPPLPPSTPLPLTFTQMPLPFPPSPLADLITSFISLL